MAIWGSIIGGMLGFSIGGPFGMLLGSLIGGKMSRARSSGGFRSFAQPQQIFALSLIVLSAKEEFIFSDSCLRPFLFFADIHTLFPPLFSLGCTSNKSDLLNTSIISISDKPKS